MDIQITNWEMACQEQETIELKEGLPTSPSELYMLEWDEMNWN